MHDIDPVSDDYMQKVRLEPLVPHNGTITLVESDPNWPVLFDREAVRIRGALGQFQAGLHPRLCPESDCGLSAVAGRGGSGDDHRFRLQRKSVV